MQTRFAPQMRARDEDRVHACATLDAGLAEGQLTDDEHSTRVGLAMEAGSIADLHYLVDDLQGDTELAATPTLRPLPTALGTAVRWSVLLAVAAIVFFGVRACASDDSATGVYGPGGYVSPAAMDDIVASVPGLVGTTVVDGLSLHQDYALLAVPSASNPRRSQFYQFRKGEWTQDDDGDRDSAGTVDLADIGPGVLGGLAVGASDSLNIADIDSMFLFYRAGTNGSTVSLHAENDQANEGGYLDATATGQFIRVTPFDPAK